MMCTFWLFQVTSSQFNSPELHDDVCIVISDSDDELEPLTCKTEHEARNQAKNYDYD